VTAPREAVVPLNKRILPKVKLTYTDSSHAYYMNGKRATGVTTVAKIPVEDFTIRQWDNRQVLIGAALDSNITENVAMDLENREAINESVAKAKYVAGQHRKADRGTQMHRVLELILLDQEEKLLTGQQKRDATTLRRTLDAYKLTPHEDLVEQFVAWPDYRVAGRFDAMMERSDNSLVCVDLKSGLNAVRYPQSTSCQLALYARAPMVSDKVNQRGKDKVSIDDWRELPARLDRTRAYVLLVEPDAEIGTFHRIDIEHGWNGAERALGIINWRKELDYGKGIALEVKPEGPTDSPVPAGFVNLALRAGSDTELNILWRNAKERGCLTDDVKVAMFARHNELKLQEEPF
jgi:hypothetical protein